MGHLPLTEITRAGVQLLETWLRANAYNNCVVDIWQPGTAEIRADGKLENVLVQARTVLHPGEHTVANLTDRFALKDMAERLDRKPYVAYLAIDEQGNLVGEIIWEKLF